MQNRSISRRQTTWHNFPLWSWRYRMLFSLICLLAIIKEYLNGLRS